MILSQRCVTFAFLVILLGCGASRPAPVGAQSSLLQPYVGHWKFDFEQTLAAMVARGASEAEVKVIRELYRANPQLGPMHGDMDIQGNVAVVPHHGLEAEYRFFGLHAHPNFLCGKAWHHEDRHDPGDMSKCFVQLELKGDVLEMRVWMHDGNVDLEDPDLVHQPLESDPDGICLAPTAVEVEWPPMVYLFTR